MKDIKMILSDINKNEVKKLISKFVGNNSRDDVKIIVDIDNNVEVVYENNKVKHVFYGRRLKSKYYFARHEVMTKEKPNIDYYEEFFLSKHDSETKFLEWLYS